MKSMFKKISSSVYLKLGILISVVSICLFASIISSNAATVTDSATGLAIDTNSGAITAYSGTTTILTIPSTIDGYLVTSIGNYVFSNCTKLTSITIPNSVTSIGSCAFYGCISLTSIIIPSSVTSIENYTFQGCNSLTSITMLKGITNVGDCVFYGCTSLVSVTLPSSVTSIGNYVFQGCNSLTSVIIPSSVISMGAYVFYGCTSLTLSVSIDSYAETYAKTNSILYVYLDTTTEAQIENNAIIAITTAENTGAQSDINLAWDLVSTVNNNTVKKSLDARLAVIDTIYKTAYRDVIIAETTQTRTDIVTAINKVNKIRNTISYKANLVTKVAELKTQYNSNLKAVSNYDFNLGQANYYINQAELYPSNHVVTQTQKYINLIPQGEIKLHLQQRNEIVSKRLSCGLTKVQIAIIWVEYAETYKTDYYIQMALVKVNNLPSGTDKTTLQSRIKIM